MRGERSGVAEAEMEATRLHIAARTLDIGYRTRIAFYDVQSKQQRAELMQTALAAFSASYETARALHDAGNVTDLDLVNEETAFENQRILAAEAEADVIDAREHLNARIGFFGHDTVWTISTQLLPPPAATMDLEHAETAAIEASMGLAETRSRLLAAARRIGLSRTSGWLPDIRVGVYAERDGTRWEVGPGIRTRLPFFDHQQGTTIAREAEFDAMRERFVEQAIQIRTNVRAYRARMISAAARATEYRERLLPLRERVVHETALQYNAMQVGVFQLLQARRDQVETAKAYLATLSDYWQARAVLEWMLAGGADGNTSLDASTNMASAPLGASDRNH